MAVSRHLNLYETESETNIEAFWGQQTLNYNMPVDEVLSSTFDLNAKPQHKVASHLTGEPSASLKLNGGFTDLSRT